MLYLAYGMNTNTKEMARRCPQAQSLGSAVMPDFELVFRVYCDVQPKEQSMVYGVLWEITDDCLAALDRLEGFPDYYDRIWVDVWHRGSKHQALCYQMRDTTKEPQRPTIDYWNMVSNGYFEHEIPLSQLSDALYRTWPTNYQFGE